MTHGSPHQLLREAVGPSGVAEALALLSHRLLAARSATRALFAWCEERGIGAGSVEARRHSQGPAVDLEDDVLERLHRAPGEPVLHRRVTLLRGVIPLSEADNWFLPARLQPGMLRLLERTDLPFGLVIEPLGPRRRTYLVARAAAAPILPDCVLEHRAVVLSDSTGPLAVVRERYARRLLGPAGQRS